MTERAQRMLKALAGERGVALPIALTVLVMTLALATLATAVAINNNAFTNRDSNAKMALDAADAGARAASYRLNQYRPADGSCPTPTTTTVGASGLCAADTESLGNGTSFTYYVSRVLQTGDTCAGLTVDSSQSAIAQRCVTSVGTANGVGARVQERIAAYTSTPVFPTAIFGTKAVTISNNVNIVSNVPASPALLGTNGTLTVGGVGGGTTIIDGFQLPPGATSQIGQNVTNVGPSTGISTPYPVPTPINPGTTAQNTASPFGNVTTYQSGTCLKPASWTGTWVQTNCNYRISCPLLACDPHTGTVHFDAAGRTLFLGNNATLVLAGGYYNLCSLYLSNNSVITIAPGAKVSLFIDSPSDPNSGSPASPPAGSATNGTCSKSNSADGVVPGSFSMQQNSTLNAGGSALNTQIYVYGDPNDSPPTSAVSLQNNGSSSFALVAPFSNVTLSPSNNTTFIGAIIGYTVTIGNKAHFTYEADTGSLQSGALELYYRTFWEQCPASSSSPTNPTAGC